MLRIKGILLGFGMLVLTLALAGCGEDGKVITATGTVEMTEINLSSKVGGIVVKIRFNEGDWVKNGTLLAELDHAELDEAIAAARAGLAVSRVRWQKSRDAMTLVPFKNYSEVRSAQIKLAENNLAAAAATLEQANQDLGREQKLFHAELVAQADLDQVVTRQKVALAQYQAAQNQLELTKSDPNAEDIDLTTQNSQALITQSASALEQLETQLDETKLYATTDGVVESKLAEEGEMVTPGTPVLTLLDYANPWVKIYLPLPDLERIRLNQDAGVALDAYPKKKFPGRVTYISEVAEFTPKDYLSQEERVKQVFAVKVTLDNSRGIFKAGIPVVVTLVPNK